MLDDILRYPTQSEYDSLTLHFPCCSVRIHSHHGRSPQTNEPFIGMGAAMDNNFKTVSKPISMRRTPVAEDAGLTWYIIGNVWPPLDLEFLSITTTLEVSKSQRPPQYNIIYHSLPAHPS